LHLTTTAEVLLRAGLFSRAVEAVGIMPKTKGKIPRINFEAGEPIAFSDENWETIEEAYGHPISGEVRT